MGIIGKKTAPAASPLIPPGALQDKVIETALDRDEHEQVRLACLAGLRGTNPLAVQALLILATEESSLGRAVRERFSGMSAAEAGLSAGGGMQVPPAS